MTTSNNRNTSVALGEPLTAFIGQLVESGRYGNASEVVRSALRLLEERETKLAELRAVVAAGRASPIAPEFSLSRVLARIDSTPK